MTGSDGFICDAMAVAVESVARESAVHVDRGEGDVRLHEVGVDLNALHQLLDGRVRFALGECGVRLLHDLHALWREVPSADVRGPPPLGIPPASYTADVCMGMASYRVAECSNLLQTNQHTQLSTSRLDLR